MLQILLLFASQKEEEYGKQNVNETTRDLRLNPPNITKDCLLES